MKKAFALFLSLVLLCSACSFAGASGLSLADKLRSRFGTDDAVPPVEITRVTGKDDDLYIVFKNNTDTAVRDIDFTLLTLNEDGSIATIAETNDFAESYKHSHSAYWTLNGPIQAGDSVTCYSCFTFDYGTGESFIISVKEYPVVAAAVQAFTSDDGQVHVLGSDQMTFVSTADKIIPPTGEYTSFQTISDEDAERAATLSLGMNIWEVPAYSADFFELPAGHYINRVLAGSIPKNAGLRKGDVILSYGEMPATMPYAQEYCELSLLDGESVEVTYWRRGEIKTVTFTNNK